MFRTKNGKLSAIKLISFIFIVIIALSVVFGSFTVIPAGHTGVVVTLGKVSDTVLQEGMHFKIPFVQQIVQIDNRVVKLEVSTEAFSRDLQTVSTVLAVNYRISTSQSYSIYKNVGPGFEDVLVRPAVNEVLKAVVAQYTASELVSTRSEVSIKLDEDLNGKLNPNGIFVEDINIIDWDFSEEYIAAIEQKQVAEQNLIKTRTEQEQQVVIAEAGAKQKVIAAEAEAESALIAAEAEAQRITLEAQAQADANRLLSESLTALLIEYQSIQRWDGKLPLITGGATPFVDLNNLPE